MEELTISRLVNMLQPLPFGNENNISFDHLFPNLRWCPKLPDGREGARMTNRSLRLSASAAAIALFSIALADWSHAQTQQSGQPSTAKGDWPMYFADPSGSRYSPLDQIDASNFNRLVPAWHFKTDNLGARPEYKLEGTPLEINGTVYTTAGSRRAVI